MFEYNEVHFKFTATLYHCITVDMLFNIVGNQIYDNYESWKYIGQKNDEGPSCPR